MLPPPLSPIRRRPLPRRDWKAIVCLFSLATCPCLALEPAKSRSFNGITAAFQIKNPVIKIGEDLKVVVEYRNVSIRKVNFRFFHLDERVELYPKGEAKPIIGGFVGEAPHAEVTLNPGESYSFEDVINMKVGPT